MEAQNSLDAWLAAEAEASTAAKAALVFVVRGEVPGEKTMATFKKALAFYQTPSLGKALDNL